MRIKSAIAAMLVSAATCFAQGYVCAEGGGTGSGAWAAEMYGWMAEKGGKGAAVLLGAVELEASDKPDSREVAFVKAGASSAKSLVITEKNADTQEIYDAITAASIVFIRGGSQSRYVEMWKGTKTEAAIRAVFAKGGVVGGTSAGCAILGEMSYDAVNGSLKPEEIVRDAQHPDLTLTKGFLGLVPGVLFDTHFGERARLPRLMTMLAHCREHRRIQPLGIGLDPKTALCVSPDGTAEVRGEGYATVLELSPKTALGLRSKESPTITNVYFTLVPAGARLDLNRREFLDSRVAVQGIAQSAMPLGFPRTEVAVAMEAVPVTPPPAEGAPLTAPDERPKAEWVKVVGSAGAPAVWCIKNPYAQPKATMDRVHSLVGEPLVAVLVAPGGVAYFEGGRVSFPGQAPTSGPSSIVLDTTGVADKFLPGTFKKPAVYRAMVHLLPSGSELNLATGSVAEIPHPEKSQKTGQ
jgi:cyanophycinase